ncbi:MAG TPA: minichromosome maintenance protein MCM [Candidatus Bathyarchaeota archaeon]|nr:minichromosome maintenance protein MCM [Candidatus Bathyarchaeota archaeon]
MAGPEGGFPEAQEAAPAPPGEEKPDIAELAKEKFEALFKTEKYRQRIAKMARDRSTSVLVDFEDIYAMSPELANALVEDPRTVLSYASVAAKAQLKIEEPDYAEEVREVSIRISKLPELLSLRRLSSSHIGRLVSIEGIVVRATPVKPLVVNSVFKCLRCNQPIITGVGKPMPVVPEPRTCPFCKSKGPFELDESRTEFVDYQELRIQEKPEDLPPGQLPRWVNVRIIGSDLVDVARPGDRVVVTGIVRVSNPSGRLRRGLEMYIEANNIDVATREAEAIEISPEEEELIRKLAKDPNIHEKIIRSIAPSIYGHEHIKEAIMYLLFGGVTKELPDVRKRGDIHVLLIGDPGTGKSALLQYVAKIAPRGLYTSGRGTTAAGLTAAVIREAQGGMSLEAGALVLADKGVCAIDEIEKMRPEDRVAMHEALEQQTISIAKGGIVATLNARTAVLAAANPALGRYDPYRSVVENISLPITILSRFDLIFVIRDVPDKEHDARMAEHILETHKLKEPTIEPPIPPDLLRKYISYAKNIEPKLTEEAIQVIRDFYLEMRSKSEGEGAPIAITARQLETLIRIAEAHARAALREFVTVEDAQAAVNMMKRSLQEVGIDLETKRIDIDVIMTGKPKSLRDKLQIVLDAIRRLDEGDGVSEAELIRELEANGLTEADVRRLLGVLLRDGMIFEARPGRFRRV